MNSGDHSLAVSATIVNGYLNEEAGGRDKPGDRASREVIHFLLKPITVITTE